MTLSLMITKNARAFINPFITNQINGIDYTNAEKLELFQKFYFTIHHKYLETTAQYLQKLSLALEAKKA